MDSGNTSVRHRSLVLQYKIATTDNIELMRRLTDIVNRHWEHCRAMHAELDGVEMAMEQGE